MNRPSLLSGCGALAGLLLGSISSLVRPGVPLRSPGSAAPASVPNYRRIIQGSASESEEAMGIALAALAGKPDLLDLARLGEVLDHLDSPQMSKLLDRLERDATDSDDRLAWLFLRWRKSDPDTAALWLKPRLIAAAQDGPKGIFFEESTSGLLIIAWAKVDPQAALDFARQHPRCGLAKNLLIAALDASPGMDRSSRLQLVLHFAPGPARGDALQHLLEAWAGTDPSGALATAQALADQKERQKNISSVLAKWSKKDPGGALAKYQALGLSDPILLSALLTNVAEQNPAHAAEFLAQLEPAQIARNGPALVSTWAATDPAAALAWALDFGVSVSAHFVYTERIIHAGLERTSEGMGGTIDPVNTALRNQPAATLAWIDGLPPGSDRDRLVELAAKSPDLNLDQALQIFSTLPPDAAARTARTLATRFTQDPAAGEQWASALPPGAVRDQAWAGLGTVAGKTLRPPAGPDRDAFLSGEVFSFSFGQTPTAGLEAAAQISDPVLRHDMLDQAMESFAETSPKECRVWLESAAVPEDWKIPWRAALTAGPATP